METQRFTISNVISLFIFYFNLIFYHNPNNLERMVDKEERDELASKRYEMEVKSRTEFKEQNEI